METVKVTELAISDNGFIFDPATGYSYSANETGFMLLRMLQSGLDKAEIRQQFLTEYETTPDSLDSDLEHFILMLRALNLIGVGPEDADAV
ncbi:MAG: PqqD family protein [Candidatus Cloacimonetes bacterium]|nr:PqqD family protein [Candidatus Cloacimonadota bacterium]